MLHSAPTLETERLTLREFRKDDLDAHAATLGDEEVMRHIGGKPMNREDSWRRLLGGIGMWSLIGMGPWAVELKADGRMVGHCGFFQFGPVWSRNWGQIERVEKLYDAYHLRFADEDVMVAYLLEVTRSAPVRDDPSRGANA